MDPIIDLTNNDNSDVTEIEISDSESVAGSSTSSSSVSAKTNTKRNKVSPYHQYFTLDETRNRFICKFCRSPFVKLKDGSTGNLVNHMKKKHYSELPLATKNKVTSIRCYLNTEGQDIRQFEKFSPEGFKRKLTTVIVQENEPFSLVESQNWQNLFLYLNPEARVPKRTTVRSKISNIYASELENLIRVLEEVPGKISIIIDCWTSRNQHPFLGIVGEWINKNWEFEYMMLDLKLLEGSHTGANIAAATVESLEMLKIFHRIHTITTDNASNMDTFFVEYQKIATEKGIRFDSDNCRVRCFAHILNLCCQDAIKYIDTETIGSDDVDITEDLEVDEEVKNTKGLVSKLRKAIVKIRASPQRRQLFRRQCTAAALDHLELERDVPTRWNSTYDMIVRALTQKEALDCTLSADKDLCKFKLSESDWKAFEYTVTFLQPFKDITVFLSSEKFPTISYCALMYSTMFSHLEKYEISQRRNLNGLDERTGLPYPEWLRNASMKAKEKLEKYYDFSDCKAYIIGTILDPRFKLAIFSESMKLRPNIVNGYKRLITETWNSTYKSQETNEPKETESNPSFLAQQLSLLRRDDSSDELERYLKDRPVSSELCQNGGGIGWWKNHQPDYPAVSLMARDFLSTCGTGVPVERLFSLGPPLLVANRQRLSAESIRECISLKCWLDFKSKMTANLFSVAVQDKATGYRAE